MAIIAAIAIIENTINIIRACFIIGTAVTTITGSSSSTAAN